MRLPGGRGFLRTVTVTDRVIVEPAVKVLLAVLDKSEFSPAAFVARMAKNCVPGVKPVNVALLAGAGIV